VDQRHKKKFPIKIIDMTPNTDDIIKEAFLGLSPVVRKVLTSTDLPEKLRRLSKKHALHLDKWALLENEINMTLLGITDPDALIANIHNHVGVDEGQAREIANDAALEIFNPIRDELEANLSASRGKTASIPVEQRMALDEMGEVVPKSVTQDAPKTVAGIVEARLKEVAVGNTTTEPTKETIPKNPVADSSHMRRVIANDSYREQI
jgi:hypothetical protein